MTISRKLKVIIDTNLFISFLIGKRLKNLQQPLTSSKIELIFSHKQMLELKLVTSRPKFKKYFNQNDVNELIDLLYSIGKIIQVKDEPVVCRDPKDNFLLGLAQEVKADFLISGDKDLTEIVQYKKTKIINADCFFKVLENLK